MKNLRKLRKKKGLSQQKLADILHISQQSVYKYENDITAPDIDTLLRMAAFFNTSVDYLIGNTDIEHKIEVVTETMLNENKLRCLAYYRALNNKKKELILELLKEMNA